MLITLTGSLYLDGPWAIWFINIIALSEDIPVTFEPLDFRVNSVLYPVNPDDISSKIKFLAYGSSAVPLTPDLINDLPLKVEWVAIPVQYTSSGSAAVVLIGVSPLGAV